MGERAQKFIDALWTLEGTKDVGPIASLFRQGADISNPLVKHAGEGERGAAQFWTHYRAAFGAIRSEFRNVVEEGDAALLEWVSEGDMGGEPIRYGGVSVLEFEEGPDGLLRAFRTYFDPTQLGAVVKG